MRRRGFLAMLAALLVPRPRPRAYACATVSNRRPGNIVVQFDAPTTDKR